MYSAANMTFKDIHQSPTSRCVTSTVCRKENGSDTTLIKLYLAKRLGLVGISELFHYNVAGGGNKLERSIRYKLQVRPVHTHDNHQYTVEAMGIKQLAHDSPAIDETIFDDFTPGVEITPKCLVVSRTT